MFRKKPYQLHLATHCVTKVFDKRVQSENDGSRVVHRVASVLNSELQAKVIRPADYKLSDLLRANVPLQSVRTEGIVSSGMSYESAVDSLTSIVDKFVQENKPAEPAEPAEPQLNEPKSE